ncbi:GPW/gp25 family protein [Sphingomonas faeni]|uniref:GPW/gp25 family protein n=1 Tax=Sphingomonas faeni TaxID=185950 RepID=UPI003349BE7A
MTMTMTMPVAGFGFPFRIDPLTGGIARAAGLDKIRQNIRVILATRLGERPMLRDYGTRLASLVHDPNDEALAVLIRREVQQALLAWEPRIMVTGLSIERQGGESGGGDGDPDATLALRLDYTLTNDAATDRLMVPLG